LAVKVGHARKRGLLAWGFEPPGQPAPCHRPQPKSIRELQRPLVNRHQHADGRVLDLLTHAADREAAMLRDLSFKICALIVQRGEPQ
jgi:hypothetical protein